MKLSSDEQGSQMEPSMMRDGALSRARETCRECVCSNKRIIETWSAVMSLSVWGDCTQRRSNNETVHGAEAGMSRDVDNEPVSCLDLEQILCVRRLKIML